MSQDTGFLHRVYLATLLGTVSFAAISLASAAQSQTVNLSSDANGFSVADVLNRGTISINAQTFDDSITATILDGALQQSSGGAVENSSVVIEDNQLLARAFGNQSDMQAQLLGSGANGRLGLLSGQDARGAVTANVNGSTLTAEITTTDNAAGSSFTASANRLEAAVTVNEARSVFADNVSAELVAQLANDTTALSTVSLISGLGAQLVDVDGGSSVVASSQVMRDDALTSRATVNDNTIDVDLREGAQISNGSNSALSVDGNILRATLTGNTAVAGTDLSVDTLFQGSAAVLNQQQIGDGSDAINLRAEANNSALRVDLGTVTDSAVSVADNRIGASASGIVGRNGSGPGTFLNVEANQINAAGGEASVSFGAAGELNLDASFVLGTQQLIVGDAGDTSAITAQALRSGLTVLSRGVEDSALDVTGNTLFATAGGNEGGSEIQISGTSINASAALGNEQRVTNTSIRATLGNGGAQTELSATVEGQLTDSSIAVDSNLLLAQAEANVGRNLLSVDSDTVLTRTSPNNRAVITNDDDVARGGLVLASSQEFSGSASVLSAAADSALSVTVGQGIVGAIGGSSVSISDNTQMVMAEANQIVNALELSALSLGEGVEAATSILSNRQDVDVDAITATSDLTARLTQGTPVVGTDRIAGSSLSVDGNENRSVVMGNEAGNLLSLTADTVIVGNLGQESRANFEGNFPVLATSVLANRQSLEADTLIATATTGVALLSEANINAFTNGSDLSLSDNRTIAGVTGNAATSRIEQDAGTASGATAALRNLQTGTADATATANGRFELSIRGNVENTSLAIDRNRLFSSVTGNTSQSTITASATSFDTPAGSIDYNARFDGTTVVGQARADFALLSDQAQGGNLAANTEVEATLLVQGASGGRNFTGTSASIDDTLARADALANEAVNRLDVEADADANNVTGAIASRQQSTDGISAAVTTVGTDFTLQNRGSLTDSRMSIDGTSFIARAGANTVENQLSFEAVSLTGATLQSGFNALGARLNLADDLVLARSDASIANLQDSGSSVTATARFEAAANTLVDNLLRSNASVSRSALQAQAAGNRASNLAEIFADGSVTGTSAVANAQISRESIIALSDAIVRIRVNVNQFDIGNALDNSAIAIDDNIALTRATGNIATSALQVNATSIAGISDTSNITDILVPDGGTGNVRARADFVVASQQLTTGAVSAGTDSTQFDMGLRQLVAGNILASAASISGNIGQSVANANQATNLVDLAAATEVSGTAAIVNDQSGSAAVDANFDLIAVLRQDLSASNPEPQVSASSIALDDNLSISVARGNDAVNNVSVAGASVSGRDNTTSVGATGSTLNGAGNALLANTQNRTAGQGITASASIRADALLTSINTGGDPVDTPSSLTDSSVSISGNFVDSTASANRARNTMVLNADTAQRAGGGIVTSQGSDSDVTSDVRITARAGSDAFGDISSSSVALNANIGVARATGNEAVSRMNVQGGTAVIGQGGSGGSASFTASPGALNAAGDFALVSNQDNSGAVMASAGDTIGDRSLISATTQGALLNSSVSVSNNALVADATSNRADNRMTVSGRPASENVTVAVASRQVATGPVTAQVNSGRMASASGAITSSAVRVSGNQFSAGATGNVATTRLTRD
ncbi:hypothetical protein LY56_01730 [Roseinatronobacter thiooxidans]|uniref:Autotransporter adhesin n=1 Tax=Roseinatronobacter thiooxidans TaxID=121821 RepID=A0A2W7R4Y9_9RHOB|nr:hypothetical protein [Roseinatronobacter thiooxidans]PZX45705.1 hypothetical protein LY56_01730 [Roseinatronobacter thiooxidans]